MRALMKGKAANFFNKKSKKIIDPQIIMNEIQAKVLCRYIGIDEAQIQKYAYFFEQVTKIKLPKGYTRYPSLDKTQIHYYNELTGEQHTVHPSIDIIKTAFYKLVADVKSVATFNIKTNRLLPFVEDKMIKQCIGLSSKRRDAEKANMQRDQNGKVVLSKLARIKPDIKILLNTRSYMLKALVQKIYTKKQLWGKGKKASVYSTILNAQRKYANNNNDEQQQQKQQSEQTLQLYENIYVQSCKFYQQMFGILQYIPQYLQKSKLYFRSTPQSVLRNLGILNIQKNRTELYWIARLMECLPLPSGWSMRKGDTFDKFYYEPKKLLFDLHPSYIYALQNMNKFKLAYQQMDIIQQNYYNNIKQMVFYDYFQRSYTVDIFAYVQKVTDQPMTKKKSLIKAQSLAQNDWMVLEGYKNSQLQIHNIVLMEDIGMYWGSINCKQDNYIPAISPFGSVIWSSTINQRTINFCPHQDNLKYLINNKQNIMPNIQPDKDLKVSKIGSSEEWRKYNDRFVLEELPVYRQSFLHHYIRNDPKPLSQPFTVTSIFKQEQFYDDIFISPFDLQSDLNLQTADVPLWLQKVHASRKYPHNTESTNLYFSQLSINPQNVQSIKQQFTKYTIQTIKKHEPSRQQDIMKVISDIHTINELKKLILHINDIDGRQQRKKLSAIGSIEQDQDSFGSISQIQVQNKQQQQQQQQDDVIDIQGSQSNSDKDKDKDKDRSISSNQGNQIQIQTQSQQPIQEQSQQQSIIIAHYEQYPSTNNKYTKNRDIQQLGSDELDGKLLDLKKQQLLKHKFSHSSLRDSVDKLSSELISNYNYNNIVNQQLYNRKRNALITKYQSQFIPYQINPSKIIHHNVRVSTAIQLCKDQSEEYDGFKSQTSIIGNQQINSQIRQLQIESERRKKQQQQMEKKQQFQQQTKETIMLEPIKRIKPDIFMDARLRHISSIQQVRQFTRTFNQVSPTKFVKINPQYQKSSIKKVYQDSTATTGFNLEKSLLSTQIIKRKGKDLLERPSMDLHKFNQTSELMETATKILAKTSGLQKSKSVLSLSNNSKSPTKFNRVCLGNTASTLLTTEAVLQKGDLMILEARKSLISKGRGLITELAKKY